MTRILLGAALLALAFSHPAHAQDADADLPDDPEAGDVSDPALDPRYPSAEYIDRINERASNLAFGYGLGRMGDGLALGLRAEVPVAGTFWLRPMVNFNFGPFEAPFDPVASAGVHFMFRSPLFLGVFRLYGGGGFDAFWRPSPAAASDCLSGGDPIDLNDQTAVDDCQASFTPGGGGYSGIEFFAGGSRVYFFEIGGGAGGQKNGRWDDAGAIIRAGNVWHF